ncbi:tyrosine-type recombinase/integrase [uncultured Actinomyces sp.]|uniref:tyrosine-type recombinase/integrase n=1 Tax=uncultured Actinomyces sp. TaxID=249061 RepID=UPI00262F47E5|nr:tyrosine-type recombinase/integrase [uncultured Actinomyces sp.]
MRVSYQGKRHMVGSYRSLAEAKAALTLAKADIVRGTYKTPEEVQGERQAAREREAAALAVAKALEEKELTVSAWSEQWLDQLIETGRSDGTLRTYRSTLSRHILPALGKKKLGEVTQDDVDRLLRSRKTPAVRTNVSRVLRSLYLAAVDQGVGGLTAVPFRLHVPKPQVARGLDSSKVATPEQVRALAEALPERLSLAAYLAAIMSLRLGEVLGLQRGDFEGLDSPGLAVLHIRRQWNSKAYGGGASYSAPKAGSEGVLAVPEELAAQVRAHLERWVGEAKTSPLFPSAADPSRPLSQTRFDEEWRAARVKAGMPAFRFHDLRHTGLTLYAQAGATLSEIMARGRHKHPEVAVRYQHATLERDRANAAVLGAAFSA